MKIRFKLTTPPEKIERIIAEKATDYLNRKIRKNSNRVVSALKNKIEDWVRDQPEVDSLLKDGEQNSLNALFGFPPSTADNAIEDIIAAIVDSTSITIEKISNRWTGKVEFAFQPKNFANVLGLSAASLEIEGDVNLPWLEWLLLKGDAAVVVGYRYLAKEDGRSGGGIMIEGSYFRVPPQFAGSYEDNFITRAFLNRQNEITPIMSRLFE